MKVALVTVGSPDRISGGYLYQRRIADGARAHDVAVRMVSLPARRFPLAIAAGRRTLRDAESGSDVVVIDSLASSALAPWLRFGGPRRPLVASVHQRPGGTDVHRLRLLVQGWLDRLAYRRCAAIVVPSPLLADQIAAVGIERDRIHVVPPGRDVPERDRAADGAVDEQVGDLRQGRRAAVLCVANWVERKGILPLLDAVAGTTDELFTLHLVGDEDLDPEYRRRVEDRLAAPDLRGRVHRHGMVPPARVPAFYAAADVFVLASSEEPYGMVYAEAMLAGLPVVGWDAGNLPNLITDGQEGRVVPLGDVAALRAALVRLATDEAERRRLGAAAARAARRLPTWEDTTAGFVAACRAAAHAGGMGRR